MKRKASTSCSEPKGKRPKRPSRVLTVNSKDGYVEVDDQPELPGLTARYFPGRFASSKSALVKEIENRVFVPRVGIPGTPFAAKSPQTVNYYLWVADDASWVYAFSSVHRNPLAPVRWTPELTRLREEVEKTLGLPQNHFNAVLVNLYPGPGSTLSAHSDKEEWFHTEDDGSMVVASLSFGAERTFVMRPISATPVNEGGVDAYTKAKFVLSNGTLATMEGLTQSHWTHSIDKEPKAPGGFRVNLTFRRIDPQKAKAVVRRIKSTSEAQALGRLYGGTLAEVIDHQRRSAVYEAHVRAYATPLCAAGDRVK